MRKRPADSGTPLDFPDQQIDRLALVWAPDTAHLAGALLSPAGPVVEVYRVGDDFEFAGPPRIVDELGPSGGWTTSAPRWRSARVLEFSAHNEISRQDAVYLLDLTAGEIRPA